LQGWGALPLGYLHRSARSFRLLGTIGRGAWQGAATRRANARPSDRRYADARSHARHDGQVVIDRGGPLLSGDGGQLIVEVSGEISATGMPMSLGEPRSAGVELDSHDVTPAAACDPKCFAVDGQRVGVTPNGDRLRWRKSSPGRYTSAT
jgi:hypothetical protein